MKQESDILELIQSLKKFATYVESKILFEEKIVIPWSLIYKIAQIYQTKHEELLLNLLNEKGIISGYIAIITALVDEEKSIPKIFEKYISEERIPDLKNVYKLALTEFMNKTVAFLNSYLTRQEVYEESILYDVIDVLLDIKTIDAILLLKNLALHPIDSVAITAIYALAEIESPASKKVLFELYKNYNIEKLEVKEVLREALIKVLEIDESLDLLRTTIQTDKEDFLKIKDILEKLPQQVKKSLNKIFLDSWRGEYAEILNYVESRLIAYSTAENTLTAINEVMSKLALISWDEIELLEEVKSSISERLLNLVSFFEFENNLIRKEPPTTVLYQTQVTKKESFSKILEQLKKSFEEFEITFKEEDIIWIHPKDEQIENGILIYYFPENNVYEVYIFGESWKIENLESLKKILEEVFESNSQPAKRSS